MLHTVYRDRISFLVPHEDLRDSLSNVMLVCPKCDEITRVGISREDGKAHRICKRCDAVID